MQDFKIVEEKAIEWNVSMRHIQYLCRKGAVQGAVKHGGVWFIPSDTPSPVKNTKSNATGFVFVGTRKKIFEGAINLFMHNGFSNVSLRDIANSVGIRQSTIYNHFRSKQEILDTIYDFYCHFFIKDRPGLEEITTGLNKLSLIDIIMRIRYNFKEEYSQQMSDITKIVLQRINIDSRAREIAKSLIMDEGVTYVEAVFDKAIQLGRFDPFDTHSIAIFINSVRIFTMFNWIIDPEQANLMKMYKDEITLYGMAAKFLDKK